MESTARVAVEADAARSAVVSCCMAAVLSGLHLLPLVRVRVTTPSGDVCELTKDGSSAAGSDKLRDSARRETISDVDKERSIRAPRRQPWYCECK